MTDETYVDTGCPPKATSVFGAVTARISAIVGQTEYGTKAMYGIYDRIKPHFTTMRRSGIVGDQRHGSGYHRSRKKLRAAGKAGDYSIQAPADNDGPDLACAAIDISFGPEEMKVVTRRLMDAFKPDSQGKYDSRIECCREFFGTLDGKKVTGWNRYKTGRPVGYVTADDSHLWHIHLSVFRRYVDDPDLMGGLADVIAGIPLKESPIVATPTTYKQLSLNVLHRGYQDPEDRPWAKRKAILGDAIKATEASILSLQECDLVQARDLADQLGDWTWQRTTGGMNVVMWDPKQWDLLLFREFDYPGSNTSTSKMLFCQLRNRVNGDHVWAASAHLQTAKGTRLAEVTARLMRVRQARAIVKRLDSYRRIVLGADLNNRNSKSGPRKVFAQAGWAWHNPGRLDDLLSKGGVTVSDARSVDVGAGSDHNAVLATVTLSSAPSPL